MKKECSSIKKDRYIPVRDCGRTLLIFNEECKDLTVVEYDGCEVDEGSAADFVVRSEGFRDLVVELKGRNLDDAIDQIIATFSRLAASGDLMSERVGAVFCKQVPMSGRSILRKRELVKKRFSADVKISSSLNTFCFEKQCFVQR